MGESRVEVKVNGCRLVLMVGDITEQDTEAIVNAANEGLRGGGGVDGAIHRAGGPEIAAACRKIREEKGGCPTGQAVITPGGWLRAKYVIHAVGPVWRGGKYGEEELLSSAYRSSLRLAREKGIKTLSFPAISTGVYGYPLPEAARVALTAIVSELEANNYFQEIRVVLFNEEIFRVFKEQMQKNFDYLVAK